MLAHTAHKYKRTSKYYHNSKITHDKWTHVVGSKTCDLLTRCKLVCLLTLRMAPPYPPLTLQEHKHRCRQSLTPKSASPLSDRSQSQDMIHHWENSSKFSPVSFSSSANTLYSGSASSSSNVSLTSVAENKRHLITLFSVFTAVSKLQCAGFRCHVDL